MKNVATPQHQSGEKQAPLSNFALRDDDEAPSVIFGIGGGEAARARTQGGLATPRGRRRSLANEVLNA